jgi:hypothetical protein
MKDRTACSTGSNYYIGDITCHGQGSSILHSKEQVSTLNILSQSTGVITE